MLQKVVLRTIPSRQRQKRKCHIFFLRISVIHFLINIYMYRYSTPGHAYTLLLSTTLQTPQPYPSSLTLHSHLKRRRLVVTLSVNLISAFVSDSKKTLSRKNSEFTFFSSISATNQVAILLKSVSGLRLNEIVPMSHSNSRRGSRAVFLNMPN